MLALLAFSTSEMREVLHRTSPPFRTCTTLSLLAHSMRSLNLCILGTHDDLCFFCSLFCFALWMHTWAHTWICMRM